MGIQSSCSAAEDERCTTGHTIHTTGEEMGKGISDRDFRSRLLMTLPISSTVVWKVWPVVQRSSSAAEQFD